jgi:hypothetical protein
MEISQASIDLMIAWEVGGGDRDLARSQYDDRYTHPHWPGNAGSGLTIGIGYDLKYARSWFESDWKSRLEAIGDPKDTYARLLAHVGRGGSLEAVRQTRQISIPWADAMAVFKLRRLPDFIEETKRVFPGVESLDAHVWGALTSVIFNCGSGTSGETRALKRKAYEAIRDAVATRSVADVAAGIRALKDFHDKSPKVAGGLKKRREDEAVLVESVLTTEPQTQMNGSEG